jgi:hypothetical protein
MLKVTKQGRVRTIDETQLKDHEAMGWSLVSDIVQAEPKKTKKTKSVDVKEEFEKELETAIDEVTPTEEN